MPARNRKDMPMKKHPKTVFAILVIISAFIAIYKQPMTLEEMYGGEISKIFIFANTFENMEEYGPTIRTAEVKEGNEAFELIEEQKFTRSLKTFIYSPFRRSHKIEEDDYEWYCYVAIDGEIITLKNFFGEVTIEKHNGGMKHIISIDKNDPWLKEVFDTAVKYAEADEQKPTV